MSGRAADVACAETGPHARFHGPPTATATADASCTAANAIANTRRTTSQRRSLRPPGCDRRNSRKPAANRSPVKRPGNNSPSGTHAKRIQPQALTSNGAHRKPIASALKARISAGPRVKPFRACTATYFDRIGASGTLASPIASAIDTAVCHCRRSTTNHSTHSPTKSERKNSA